MGNLILVGRPDGIWQNLDILDEGDDYHYDEDEDDDEGEDEKGDGDEDQYTGMLMRENFGWNSDDEQYSEY